MKKFFIAFLILAVTAGNVFAQVTYSGELFGTWDIVSGASGKDGNSRDVDDELQTKLGMQTDKIRSRFNITATNEDKTWGGAIQLRITENATDRAWVWWQPISQVKATLGLVDGFRPFSVLWGKEVHDVADLKNYGGGGGDIFSGVSANHGFALQLYPIDNLAITVGAPVKNGTAEDSYRQLAGWAGYTVEGIGTFALGYVGKAKKTAGSEIEFGANITAIPIIQLQLGVSYFLPEDDTPLYALLGVEANDEYGITGTVTKPLVVSLAWNLGAGDLGMRGHLKAAFGGKWSGKVAGVDADYEDPFKFGVAITPFYNVGIGNLGIDLELELSGSSKFAGNATDDDQLKWEVTPYFEKAYGGGTFVVGVKVGGSNYTNDKAFDDGYGQIYWAIPVGLHYSF
jgi:hypothetical protein